MAAIASPSATAVSDNVAVFEPIHHAEDDAIFFSGKSIVAEIRPQPAAWLPRAIQRVQELSYLGDNWDSYGAPSIDLRSIEFAERVLRVLAQFEDLAEPTIGASPDGFATLVWSAASWDLECECEIDRIHYVGTHDPGDSLQESGTVEDPVMLAMLLTSYMTNSPAT